jgi:hypothetical protein
VRKQVTGPSLRRDAEDDQATEASGWYYSSSSTSAMRCRSATCPRRSGWALLPARHGRASADVNPTTSPMAKLLAVTDAPQFSNVEDQIGLPSCPARGEGLTERSLECSRCFCRFASGWRPWPWSQFWSHSCGSAEVHGRTSDALTPTNTAGRCFAELESGRPARVRGFKSLRFRRSEGV